MSILDEALSMIEKKDLEGLKSLLGKRPNVFHLEAPYGWPLLHRCIAKPGQKPCLDLDLVKLFVAIGGDVNQKTDSGLSLLFLATVNSFSVKMGIPTFLAQVGARMSNFEQIVAAFMATDEDDSRKVKTVLAKLLKADPSLATRSGDKGMTLLHHAVRQRQFHAVPLLLDAGADPNSLTSSGASPLGLCPVTEEGLAGRKVLLSRGANFTPREQLLELIREGKNDAAIARFESDRTMLKAWIPGLGSFLHFAVAFGEGTAVVQCLLKKGVDPNSPDDEGRTPLFLAVEKPEVAKLLLQHGADVNWRDNYGCTPLHIAVTNKEEVARLLLESGADVNARTPDGMTPLDVILAQKVPGSKALVQYLKSKGAVRGV